MGMCSFGSEHWSMLAKIHTIRKQNVTTYAEIVLGMIFSSVSKPKNYAHKFLNRLRGNSIVHIYKTPVLSYMLSVPREIADH